MASVNKVILIGHLGQDPDIRYLANGDAVANLSLATSETWKDKNGEKQESTEWHRVVFFAKTAEVCGQYLKKGSAVYVEGSLRTRKWQDKDGNDRYTTEIRGDRMQMLGGRTGGDNGDTRAQQQSDAYRKDSGGSPAARGTGASGGAFNDMEDDIPF